VLALETLHGVRVVASPAALDAATWNANVTALRLALDDVFAIGASASDAATIEANDTHAIVVAESGFVGCWLTMAELAEVATHIEWHLPTERPAFAQGYVAGVPCKLALTDHGTLLMCAAPYAHDLMERLQ
jgi:hypothetical protein